MSQDYNRSLPVFNVPEDSTGSVLEVTIVSDRSAVDLSVATGDKYFHARTKDGAAVVTDLAATFTGDGTDGKIRAGMTAVIVESGPRDLICEFEIQGYAGGNLVSDSFILRIRPRAKVS